jgi:hypothetical protein
MPPPLLGKPIAGPPSTLAYTYRDEIIEGILKNGAANAFPFWDPKRDWLLRSTHHPSGGNGNSRNEMKMKTRGEIETVTVLSST